MKYEAPKLRPRRSAAMPQAPDTSNDSDLFNTAQPAAAAAFRKRGTSDGPLLPAKKMRTGQDPAAGLLDKMKPPSSYQSATGLPQVSPHIDTIQTDKAGSPASNQSTGRIEHTGEHPKTPDHQHPSFIGFESIDTTYHPRQAPLTRENLALLTNMAGDKNTIQAVSVASTSKTISTASAGFVKKCLENGILTPKQSTCPTNAAELRDMYGRATNEPIPTEEEYNHYCFRAANAPNEATVVVDFSKRILKEMMEPGYRAVYNQQWNNFPQNIGFNNGLSAPQPDFVEGLEVEQFRNREIGGFISAAVLTKHLDTSLILPHIAGELKGRDKNLDVGSYQSAYDGAALVYARNKALSYLGEQDEPGHAKILTFVTDGQRLEIYAHYAIISESSKFKYHQYKMQKTDLSASYDNFKDGRRWIWNLQENARQQSCAIRDKFLARWNKARGQPLGPVGSHKPTALTLVDDSIPSADNAAAQAPQPASAGAPATKSALQSLPSTDDGDTPSSGAQKRKAPFSSRETPPGCSDRKH